MIITTACGKAYTPDTCMIMRSGTEVLGSSQLAAGFLYYQGKKMTDLSCKMSLGKLKNIYLKLLTNGTKLSRICKISCCLPSSREQCHTYLTPVQIGW
jgi:hypothetical protein